MLLFICWLLVSFPSKGLKASLILHSPKNPPPNNLLAGRVVLSGLLQKL